LIFRFEQEASQGDHSDIVHIKDDTTLKNGVLYSDAQKTGVFLSASAFLVLPPIVQCGVLEKRFLQIDPGIRCHFLWFP